MTTTGTPNPQAVGELYDGFDEMDVLHFGYWPDAADQAPIEEAAARLTDLVAENVGAAPGLRLIDVGCGIGSPAVRIAERNGADITGITISAKQVARATALASAAGLADRVRFEHGDAMRMPFADGSFDAAYALESIIHMDRPSALREISRVIKPDGRVVLTDLYARKPAASEGGLMHFLADAWLMSPLVGLDEYPALAAAAGLAVVAVTDISEQVLWRTLQAVAQQLRENVKPLVPDQIVDQVESGYDAPPADLPALLENAKEMGCLLVVLQKS